MAAIIGLSGFSEPTVGGSRCSIDGWTTVDNYLPGGSSEAHANASHAIPSTNTVVVGGLKSDGTDEEWIIRRSTDSGSNWSDVYTPSQTGSNSLNGVAGLGSTLYAVGSVDVSSESQLRVIKSTDSGANWSTVDTYDGGAFTEAYGVAVDSNGVIFVAGVYDDGSDSHWLVRRSENGGANWSNVATSLGTYGSSRAHGVAVDSSDNVYVVGAGDNGTYDEWVVQKSTDGGDTWSTVDTFNQVAGESTSARAISINGSTIVVIGDADTCYGKVAPIRVSTNAGTDWATRTAYQKSPGYETDGKSVLVDSLGMILLGGEFEGSDGNKPFAMVAFDSGSIVGNYTGELMLSAGERGQASSMSVLSSGAFLAAGDARDGSGSDHWIVRRATCE